MMIEVTLSLLTVACLMLFAAVLGGVGALAFVIAYFKWIARGFSPGHEA